MPILRRSRSLSNSGRRAALALALFVPMLAACGKDSPSSPNTAGTITIESGDAQNTVVGTGVTNPLVVHVTAQNGSALAGTVVKWNATTTLGTLADSVSTTDASGNAKMTFAAGVKAGTLNITAGTGTLASVSFTQKLVADVPAALTKFGGDGAAAIASASLPIAAKVGDKYGNAVVGETVTWTIGAQGGTLSAGTSTTDADGIARTTLTLGAARGNYTVTAKAGNFPIVTFTVTAI